MRNPRTPFTAQNLLIAGATIAMVAAGFYRYREQQMDRLYAEASGTSPAFQGTLESQAAVRKLATYRGDRATAMLLNIALGRTSFPWPAIQREAINALASRGDSTISVALANLLQPHVLLPIRQAAADALQNIPCSSDCIRSVLHYLERVEQGTPNSEDMPILPPEMNALRADFAKDQGALYQALYSVLRHQARLTVEVMYQVYGIGTEAPSKVGLALLSRMQLSEACAAVLQSEEFLSKRPAEAYRAPREELETTVHALKCE